MRAFLATTTFSLASSPHFAMPYELTIKALPPKCKSALKLATIEMKKKYKLVLGGTFLYEKSARAIQTLGASNPELLITIKTYAPKGSSESNQKVRGHAENFMASNKLQACLASKIGKSCPSLNTITFGIHGSDDSIQYSRKSHEEFQELATSALQYYLSADCQEIGAISLYVDTSASNRKDHSGELIYPSAIKFQSSDKTAQGISKIAHGGAWVRFWSYDKSRHLETTTNRIDGQTIKTVTTLRANGKDYTCYRKDRPEMLMHP